MIKTFTSFIFLVLFVLPVIVLAQPGLPGSPEQTPINGLMILAAGGGAYAIKKLRKETAEKRWLIHHCSYHINHSKKSI